MILGGKRACGKSTELVKISSINNIPIIVLNNKRAEELEYIARKEEIKIPKPIPYKNCKEKLIEKRINEILIDDIEAILQEMFFPSKIIAMTTSIPFVSLQKE